LQALKAKERFGESLDLIGGAAPFEAGLYACTEMFVDDSWTCIAAACCAGAL